MIVVIVSHFGYFKNNDIELFGIPENGFLLIVNLQNGIDVGKGYGV